MRYYRVAERSTPARLWCWKTTWMTRVEEVISYLVTYRCPQPVQLRVFTAPTLVGLEDQLIRANHGELSGSWTAEQFLERQSQEVVERARLAAAGEVPDAVLHRSIASVGRNG